MRCVRTRWATAAACAVALAALPAGAAHGAVAAPQVLGGGALLPGEHDGSGNMLITLRRAADNRVRVKVDLQISCPGGQDVYVDAAIAPLALVAPDGSFRATGTRVEHFGPFELRTTYDISGAFTVSGANGTATVSLHDEDPILPTCGSADISSGPIAWQARRPGPLGTPGTVAGGLRYGITSPGPRRARGAVVLRVSPDGSAVERVLQHTLVRCTRRVASGSLSLDDNTWSSRETRIPIRPNGRFAWRFAASLPFQRVVSRASESFAGAIGSLGARGSYRHDGRIVTARTGRLRERCTTAGTIRWWASP